MDTVDTIFGPMRPVIAAVRSGGLVPVVVRQRPEVRRLATPFVTISRQPGAGGAALAQNLVARLNALEPYQTPWRAFDRELVEKVAAEHPIPGRLIEALGEESHSWLDDLFTGLGSSTGQAESSEMTAYRAVAQTIRDLAQRGRVVLVGRGSVFITSHMPGGYHFRLVAPLDVRVAEYVSHFKVPPRQAARKVRALDHNRRAFHHRFFGQRDLEVEMFDLTINTDRLSEQAMVDCLVPLLRRG